MAEVGNIGLPVLSTQDLHQAEIEQSKPTIQGALPASLAPQPTLEQHQIIGGVAQTSDRLRLEAAGKFNSTQYQVTHLSSVLMRLNRPSEGHPFSPIEAKMKPILEQHYKNLNNILSRLTWKN